MPGAVRYERDGDVAQIVLDHPPLNLFDTDLSNDVLAALEEAEGDMPREWAERLYDVRRWTPMPRGGHFPAAEEPELLAADIRAFFAEYR